MGRQQASALSAAASRKKQQLRAVLLVAFLPLRLTVVAHEGVDELGGIHNELRQGGLVAQGAGVDGGVEGCRGPQGSPQLIEHHEGMRARVQGKVSTTPRMLCQGTKHRLGVTGQATAVWLSKAPLPRCRTRVDRHQQRDARVLVAQQAVEADALRCVCRGEARLEGREADQLGWEGERHASERHCSTLPDRLGCAAQLVAGHRCAEWLAAPTHSHARCAASPR